MRHKVRDGEQVLASVGVANPLHAIVQTLAKSDKPIDSDHRSGGNISLTHTASR